MLVSCVVIHGPDMTAFIRFVFCFFSLKQARLSSKNARRFSQLDKTVRIYTEQCLLLCVCVCVTLNELRLQCNKTKFGTVDFGR